MIAKPLRWDDVEATTKPVEEFVVPWIRTAQTYSDSHMDHAWQHPETHRMMSNENPLPPAESVMNAIADVARQANLYPGTGSDLRQKIGATVGLGPDNVLLGNGSTEVLEMVIRTFVGPGEEAVIPTPTFSMYEARLRVNGGVPVIVPMTPELYWDVPTILDAVTAKTKLIFISTPNNPTGNEIREADLRRILSLGVPTLIDEAYYGLQAEPHSWVGLIREFPNAIICRTFSKAYGLAGLRLGFALGDEAIVAFLMRTRLPWNVNLITLRAAEAALADAQSLVERQATIRQGRAYLQGEIDRMGGLRSYPSEGNFLLIDATSLGRSSQAIVEALLASGVFVRPMAAHHVQDGFVRVTVGTPVQNQHFVRSLRDYVQEVRRTTR